MLAPAVGELIDWTSESLKLSDKAMVQIVGGVIAQLKEPIMKELKEYGQEEQPQLTAQAPLNADGSPVA